MRKQSQPKGEYSKKQPAKHAPTLKGRRPAGSLRFAQDKASDRGKQAPVTFGGLLRPLIVEPSGPQTLVALQSSPLAHLDYPAELAIKNQALAQFWLQNRLPGKPKPIIASPRPRGYRTTSKRKTVLKGSALYLLFNDRALRSQQKPFVESPLEPPEHSRIYAFLQTKKRT